MAMENTLFIGDVPIETPMSSGFLVATLDYQRVHLRGDEDEDDDNETTQVMSCSKTIYIHIPDTKQKGTCFFCTFSFPQYNQLQFVRVCLATDSYTLHHCEENHVNIFVDLLSNDLKQDPVRPLKSAISV